MQVQKIRKSATVMFGERLDLVGVAADHGARLIIRQGPPQLT
ncbi:hypothetical protein AB0C13_18435 [Streptomyces sp. NPDC049099]